MEKNAEKIEPPRKRGRPRKELATVNAPHHNSDDSDGDGVDHGIPEGMENPNDPHCICKKPYNSKRSVFYINCIHQNLVDFILVAMYVLDGFMENVLVYVGKLVPP